MNRKIPTFETAPPVSEATLPTRLVCMSLSTPTASTRNAPPWPRARVVARVGVAARDRDAGDGHVRPPLDVPTRLVPLASIVVTPAPGAVERRSLVELERHARRELVRAGPSVITSSSPAVSTRSRRVQWSTVHPGCVSSSVKTLTSGVRSSAPNS